VKITSFYEFK